MLIPCWVVPTPHAGCHETLSPSASDVFEVARALPFVRIVTVVPRLRSVLSTVGGIIALVARFAIVYCGISYAFAVVGMAIFGGVSQADNNGFCQNCQMWTLESFSKTWLALLQLTVGNNWNSILYPNVRLHTCTLATCLRHHNAPHTPPPPLSFVDFRS